jgi:hypothetical protein
LIDIVPFCFCPNLDLITVSKGAFANWLPLNPCYFHCLNLNLSSFPVMLTSTKLQWITNFFPLHHLNNKCRKHKWTSYWSTWHHIKEEINCQRKREESVVECRWEVNWLEEIKSIGNCIPFQINSLMSIFIIRYVGMRRKQQEGSLWSTRRASLSILSVKSSINDIKLNICNMKKVFFWQLSSVLKCAK